MNQLHAPKASRNQETGRLSFMGPVSGRRADAGRRGRPPYRRLADPTSIFSRPTGNFSSVSVLRKTVLTAAAASLLPALAAAPAYAYAYEGTAVAATPAPSTSATAPATDGKPAGRDAGAPKQPAPPAAMSTVGGTLLGRPGTQVKLGAGAPVLPKELSARSWVVADAETGDVLAANNAHWRLPPASTLKMLFADTLLPKVPKTDTRKVTWKDLEGVGPGSSAVGVKEELTYSAHDLWNGVFLVSGNDAVHVLAAMNGGIDKTVQEMQAHAEELQALDTQVVSPDGYDAPGQVSSAYDLTLIARSGLQKKDFRDYAATVEAQFPGRMVDGKRETFAIANTNRLLTGDGVAPYAGIAGVKNGNTSQAGATFTGVAERNGKVLLVTVMNPDSGERQAVYKETSRLLDWGFAAAGKVTPVGELVAPRSATPPVGAGPDKHSAQTDRTKTASAENERASSGGVGTALAIAGGVLVVLAGGVFLVNRRWPRHRV
ncbi:D-alanyl-D-alanine carboxypeptidase [Streptomyces sp. NPDC058953]|uniref:D-alanyl-D-alanine carboxypeptidase n=1 Tax=unclassified Streptomyces TaxID=2593676 RepID=UPI00367B5094